MRATQLLWTAQLLSLLADDALKHALRVWLYTGAAKDSTSSGTLQQTAYALASEAPALLLAPLCGALVDAWPRARVAAAADGLAALGALVLLLLLRAGTLSPALLLFAAAWAAACNALHWPAFVLLLRDLELQAVGDGAAPDTTGPAAAADGGHGNHTGVAAVGEGSAEGALPQPANDSKKSGPTPDTPAASATGAASSGAAAKRTGMAEAAPALSMLVAPLLAAYLTEAYGLESAFYWVFATCATSTALLLFHPTLAHVGQTGTRRASAAPGGKGVDEEVLVSSAYAAHPIARRIAAEFMRLLADGGAVVQLLVQQRSLRALYGVTTVGYLASGVVQIMMVPLVLATAPAVTLGWILTLSGTGSIVGAALLWKLGLPQTISPHTTLLTIFAAQGALLVVCGLWPAPGATLGIAFAYMLLLPALRGARQVLLEAVAPAEQLGRLLAIQRALLQACLPLAALVALPLALLLRNPLRSWAPVASLPAPEASALFVLAGGACILTAAVAGVSGALRVQQPGPVKEKAA